MVNVRGAFPAKRQGIIHEKPSSPLYAKEKTAIICKEKMVASEPSYQEPSDRKLLTHNTANRQAYQEKTAYPSSRNSNNQHHKRGTASVVAP